MVRIEKLEKAFRKNKVLRGIDLEFNPGQITAVLGPNGSGKTTMLKCFLGMVIPDTGQLYLDGKLINNTFAYRKDIAYLPQIARFPENLKVYELFRMIQDIRGKAQRLEQLIEAFKLEPYLQVRLSNLSGGTKQKVNIVQALMFDSPVLILDEPTSGLDPVALLQLKALIRREKADGKTILITSHIMQFVEEIADQLVFILDGKIHFDGSLVSLKAMYDESDLETAIARLLEAGNNQADFEVPTKSGNTAPSYMQSQNNR